MVFPQNELVGGRDVVFEFVRAVEHSGFDYLLAFDHVLGADTSGRPDWPAGHYTIADPFHEPFVLFAAVCAITELAVIPGVLILPQRQTVLVAKQAAELDVLSEGRLRLGVGLGWNRVEYEALGVPFGDRAERFEEQLDVLRLLWTEDVVSWSGRFHQIDRAGILPRPQQRPIPLWVGTFGQSERALRRIGRKADGWMPLLPLGAELRRASNLVAESAADAGRDPSRIGLEGRVMVGRDDSQDDVRRALDGWREVGASHVGLSGLRCGRSSAEHLALIPWLAEAARR